MEFIGDEGHGGAEAGQARLSPTGELESAWDQLLASIRSLTAAGMVHADLSAYNLLWLQGRLVLIDLPQAVEFTTNTDALTTCCTATSPMSAPGSACTASRLMLRRPTPSSLRSPSRPLSA